MQPWISHGRQTAIDALYPSKHVRREMITRQPNNPHYCAVGVKPGNVDGRGNYRSHVFAWETSVLLPHLPPRPDQPWEEAQAVGGWLSNAARDCRIKQITSLPRLPCVRISTPPAQTSTVPPDETRTYGRSCHDSVVYRYPSFPITQPRPAKNRQVASAWHCRDVRPKANGCCMRHQQCPAPRPPPFFVWPLPHDNKTIAT